MGTRSPAQWPSSREEIREESSLLRCRLNTAPGKANTEEAGQAPRTKPSKPSGRVEGDMAAPAEEATGKAPRRYGRNHSRYQSPRTRGNHDGDCAVSLSWQIAEEQEQL